jgi:hypothetical protein
MRLLVVCCLLIASAQAAEKLKEKADAAGVVCLLRIEEQPGDAPQPEAFLVEQLKRK